MMSAVLMLLIEFDDATIQQCKMEKKSPQAPIPQSDAESGGNLLSGKYLSDAVFILHTLSFLLISRHLISMATKRNNTLLGQITKDFSDTRRLIDHVIR